MQQQRAVGADHPLELPDQPAIASERPDAGDQEQRIFQSGVQVVQAGPGLSLPNFRQQLEVTGHGQASIDPEQIELVGVISGVTDGGVAEPRAVGRRDQTRIVGVRPPLEVVWFGALGAGAEQS